MKKIIIALALSFSVFSLQAKPVFAQLRPGQDVDLPAPVDKDNTLEKHDFNKFDPLQIGGSEDITKTQASALANTLTTPGAIITRALQFAIPAAGLILFVMIVWGGFEILTSASGGKKDAGRQRVTTAVIGFILLFGAFWIAQILEVIFGIKILS
jgi:hypothetical protein